MSSSFCARSSNFLVVKVLTMCDLLISLQNPSTPAFIRTGNTLWEWVISKEFYFSGMRGEGWGVAQRPACQVIPLSDSFNSVRRLLEEAEHTRQISSDGAPDGLDQTRQATVSKLLVTLMGEKAAFNLHPRTGSKNVASELSRLFTRVQEGDFVYEEYHRVLRLIFEKAPTADIWKAILMG
ncbi:conserved hypothetical protein [Coccidioides posadasii str. Silveira]|uniref:Uncharacterized protein n=1 Tax=Coccidioides posadasii (strain RMSCC 757 / Silveira) TaxID=443226 RepID=E9D400_COCPS|nr:conserved hypothetical protein [Coccidioides posadasii str. Silveira]